MERDAGVKISCLKVDGGASANNFLMQFQSDILGVKIARPNVVETTALGAAYLAGLGCGVWGSVREIERLNVGWRQFLPALAEDKRQSMLNGWRAAVEKARLK